MAKLGKPYFLFCCDVNSLPACLETVEAAVRQKQQVMLNQLSLTVFKYDHMIDRNRN